jgi:hypothetical protein
MDEALPGYPGNTFLRYESIQKNAQDSFLKIDMFFRHDAPGLPRAMNLLYGHHDIITVRQTLNTPLRALRKFLAKAGRYGDV